MCSRKCAMPSRSAGSSIWPVFVTSDAPDLLNLASETRMTRSPFSRVNRRKTAVSVGAVTLGGSTGAAGTGKRDAATRRVARTKEPFRMPKTVSTYPTRASPAAPHRPLFPPPPAIGRRFPPIPRPNHPPLPKPTVIPQMTLLLRRSRLTSGKCHPADDTWPAGSPGFRPGSAGQPSVAVALRLVPCEARPGAEASVPRQDRRILPQRGGARVVAVLPAFSPIALCLHNASVDSHRSPRGCSIAEYLRPLQVACPACAAAGGDTVSLIRRLQHQPHPLLSRSTRQTAAFAGGRVGPCLKPLGTPPSCHFSFCPNSGPRKP
jgi:hypothetical protein